MKQIGPRNRSRYRVPLRRLSPEQRHLLDHSVPLPANVVHTAVKNFTPAASRRTMRLSMILIAGLIILSALPGTILYLKNAGAGPHKGIIAVSVLITLFFTAGLFNALRHYWLLKSVPVTCTRGGLFLTPEVLLVRVEEGYACRVPKGEVIDYRLDQEVPQGGTRPLYYPTLVLKRAEMVLGRFETAREPDAVSRRIREWLGRGE